MVLQPPTLRKVSAPMRNAALGLLLMLLPSCATLTRKREPCADQVTFRNVAKEQNHLYVCAYVDAPEPLMCIDYNDFQRSIR